MCKNYLEMSLCLAKNNGQNGDFVNTTGSTGAIIVLGDSSLIILKYVSPQKGAINADIFFSSTCFYLHTRE